jgi:DNA anti-recombination protein RmuC
LWLSESLVGKSTPLLGFLKWREVRIMAGEMLAGLAVGLLVGFILGAVVGAWLRKAPNVERLMETVSELQRRLDEWQQRSATQQQVDRVQSDLSNAQQTLAQIDRSLQNLTAFTQNNFQPQVAQQLQGALNALVQVQQALQDAQQTLSAQAQSDEQRHAQLLSILQAASDALAGSGTLLREVSENLRSGQQRLSVELSELQKSVSVAKETILGVAEQVGVLTALKETADRIENNINQLTRILTGRKSGQAGERIVVELLGIVPEDWLERNIRLGRGQVEFAVKMPGGYLIPLDSKFVAPELVAQLENETSGKQQLLEDAKKKLREKLQERAQEIGKYLTDPKVLGFGIAAVPDSVYDLCRDAFKTAAQSHRIVVVPYSLLLPFVLSLYLMAQRLGISRLGETDQVIGTAITALEQAKQALENMGQPITTVSNQRKRALEQVEETLKSLRGLTQGEITLPESPKPLLAETPEQPPEA